MLGSPDCPDRHFLLSWMKLWYFNSSAFFDRLLCSCQNLWVVLTRDVNVFRMSIDDFSLSYRGSALPFENRKIRNIQRTIIFFHCIYKEYRSWCRLWLPVYNTVGAQLTQCICVQGMELPINHQQVKIYDAFAKWTISVSNHYCDVVDSTWYLAGNLLFLVRM